MKRLKWNSGWKVWEDKNAFELTLIVPKDAKEVELPYDALIHKEQKKDSVNQGRTGFLDGGVYNYYKTLYVSKEDRNNQFLLEFEGIFTKSFIYVNESLAGECNYPYMDFYVDITNYLKYGEKNEILVVANAMDLSTRYYTGAGIFKDVYLLKGEELSIKPESLKVTTLNIDENGAEIEIEALIENIQKSPRDIEIVVEISQDDLNYKIGPYPVRVFGNDELLFRKKMYLKDIKLWDEYNPNLCECSMKLYEKDVVVEEETVRTGIRKVKVDAINGLKINGKETKLRGGCIHHDQGLLGAATYYEYEYRRIKQMKEAGFNAVRSAHNPASKALLMACDQLGMYVMDEGFDMWTKMKNYRDYSLFFESDYKNVVEAMVRVDYNHPSVIMYSTGNEITDVGTEKGFEISRKMGNLLHELDSTRYVTNGVNGLFAVRNYISEIIKDMLGDSFEELESGDINSCMQKIGADMHKAVMHKRVGEVLEKLDSTMDILGYNYMTSRYLPDHEKYPQRIMVGSETFPPQIAENWDVIKSCPAVLGDFTWTGYSYLGETGTSYPRIINRVGDLSVTGKRKPASYYREIVFGLSEKPYIAVVSPKDTKEAAELNRWIFTNAKHCWNYPGEEGEKVIVEVYSSGDEVELYLDDELIEKKENGNEKGCMCKFETIYKPGVLKAISYKDGTQLSEGILETKGEPEKIDIEVEDYRNIENSGGIVFLNIKIKDNTNRIVENANVQLEISLNENASLLAFGSDETAYARGYDSNKAIPDGGEALAIIKIKDENQKTNVTVKASDIKETKIEL